MAWLIGLLLFIGVPVVVGRAIRFGTLDEGKTMEFFGDSFTMGSNASSGNGYVSKLCQALGETAANYAVSGTGAYQSCKNSFAAVANNGQKLSWLSGFNDLRRGGASPKTIAKIKGCLRSFLCNAFSATQVPASSCALVGVWSEMNHGGIGDRASAYLGGSGRFSYDPNATLSCNFSGTNVVIATWGSDEVINHLGSFKVTIDGANVGTFDFKNKADGIGDGYYDNSRTQNALVIKDLSTGPHSLTIAPIGDGAVMLDYIGTLLTAAQSPLVVVGDIPRMNAAGYAQAPNLANDAVIDAGNVALQEVFAEFPGYPIKSAKTNSYYSLVNGVSSDNIHPNDVGHLQIMAAFISSIFLH